MPIGKAVDAARGRDLTIITYAAMVHTCMEAADELAKEGIDAEVIDLRTLLPLDKETILACVKKTNKLLIVHEDTRTGGIAGEIARSFAKAPLTISMGRSCASRRSTPRCPTRPRSRTLSAQRRQGG